MTLPWRRQSKTKVQGTNPQQWCRLVTRSYGRSFYFASFALPPSIRSDAYALYTLCRLVDDLTDENTALGSAGSDLSDNLIRYLFEGSHAPQSHSELLTQLTRPWAEIASRTGLPASGTNDLALFLSHIQETLKRCGIRREHLDALVQGQRDDERFVRPANWSDFYRYCYRVAGVVGLMMALVFGASRDRETLLAAEHLGIAMQITNILRDLQEDFELRQRIYLPVATCAEVGLPLESPSDILTHPNEGLHLLQHFGHLAASYYQSGLQGVAGIPSSRARLCVKLMAAIYGAILAGVLRDPRRSLQQRVTTSVGQKIWIAFEVCLGMNPLRAAGLAHTATKASHQIG